MFAHARSVGLGSIALLILACGSKGSGDDSAAGGTGATSAGGTGATAGTTPVSTGGGGATGGSAGGTSIAGTSSTAGSTSTVSKSYTFDTDLETWKVEYTSAGPLPVAAGGGMAPLIDPATVMIAHTDTDGDPMPPTGAIQLNIPYTTASQYVGAGISLAAPVDLTGKVLTANIKVVSGLGDPADLVTNTGGAKLYAKSGAGYVYANGAYTNVGVIGMWIPIRFDLSAPAFTDATNPAGAFDPSDIREIGIQLDTGGTSMTATAAVDLIDTVSY